MAYFGLKQVKELRGKDQRVLLGVTGGIASGKSTVVRMLEKLGAPIIDFDLLSRIVVEPKKPAWKEIVGFFGEKILNKDKTIDRKKISEIVFRDPEKRKKLEEFTHPRIYEEFASRVREIAWQNPRAIIQAVVPLLIEANLQPLFHKILVVYVPEKFQIQRLMERDHITREMALNILSAQMPIEEKKSHADYLVDNSGNLEETRKQVARIWEEITKYQKERKR